MVVRFAMAASDIELMIIDEDWSPKSLDECGFR